MTQVRTDRRPDRYRRRFGEVAIERGLIDADQLEKALALQAERRELGQTAPLIGQALLELGFLTVEQIQEVVDLIYPPLDDPDSPEEA